LNLTKLRNIGISAHIDSGKTTLSERILYYCGRIHKMEEVHGEGRGATMDHMELERERGITITSAATSVAWQDHGINLIDTPGHVDFTVEVERSLRVLDGAVLVLCAVGGVQSQSITVDRQMRRYHVPRLAFVNKMDRAGADPVRVCQQVREKLEDDAILMQWPIGTEGDFRGVIDLITMKALYFDGDHGETVRSEAMPAELADQAASARRHMLEALSMYSDTLMELLLSEEAVPDDLVHRVVREACRSQDMTPVFIGSAYRNKGVQPLLDAVTRYLPSPAERQIVAKAYEDPDEEVLLGPDPKRSMVAMAFKIVDDPYGQLTFMRIYQGTVLRGQTYYNQRTGRKERFGRIVRMHADKREEIDMAAAGDIVAVMGIDSASGDTYAAKPKYCTLESMFVPEAVLQVAVASKNRQDAERLAKALARFRKEDPTFRVQTDKETGDILLAGMGQLHLEIYIERIRREHGLDVAIGPPTVSYREAPTQAAEFNFKHKKQTGGAGQYAHIIGHLEPLPEDAEETFVFEDRVTGGRIPKQYIPSVEKGFRQMLAKGPLAGFPVVGVRAVLEDGSHHEIDSSDMAFQICARRCFAETFPKMKPVLFEPIMKVQIECSTEFRGRVTSDVISRRGTIVSTDAAGNTTTINVEVPLAETFGYATDLRSLTQGQGTFTMEPHVYHRVPASIQEVVVTERRKQGNPQNAAFLQTRHAKGGCLVPSKQVS